MKEANRERWGDSLKTGHLVLIILIAYAIFRPLDKQTLTPTGYLVFQVLSAIGVIQVILSTGYALFVNNMFKYKVNIIFAIVIPSVVVAVFEIFLLYK